VQGGGHRRVARARQKGVRPCAPLSGSWAGGIHLVRRKKAQHAVRMLGFISPDYIEIF